MHDKATVIELGCGITGLLGVLLAPRVSNYILTDQGYVLKALRENVHNNTSLALPKGNKQAVVVPSGLHIVELDWEADSPTSILQNIPSAKGVDLVLVCDCVYNEHLIRPLVQTMRDLCTLPPPDHPSIVMVAQQLRSDTVLEEFLEALLQHFTVWRVPDSKLSKSLQTGSGYVVHFAQLR